MSVSAIHPRWRQAARVCSGDIGAWAMLARTSARDLPVYDGDQQRNGWIIGAATWYLPSLRAIVILTRDNLVKLGWWKNAQYEKCLHLSISFRDPATLESIEWEPAAARRIVEAVFGEARRLTWWEPAYSAQGKARGVQHWRLFYAADWITPIHPKGEPHTLNVPAGWREWTDYQAGQPTPNLNADITDELPKRRPSP